MSRLEKYGIKIDKNDPKIQSLLNEVKDREFAGYSMMAQTSLNY